MKIINVNSEIGKLKKVLLHRPGKEIENLTPQLMSRLLFDDIPWLEEAQKEHDAFADLLRSKGIEVVYLEDLMAEVLKEDKIKKIFIEQYIKESGVTSETLTSHLFDYLYSIKDQKELVLKTMSGIRKEEVPNWKKRTLIDYIDEYPFVCDPMPNLYFTRDPFASIGNGLSLNNMFTETRKRETIYAEYIFNYHDEYRDGVNKYYDRYNPLYIEGGDILVLNKKILAVGVSQRTHPSAIEKLAKNLFKANDNEYEIVLAFHLPKTRAYMHLDTVFTQVDHDKFTIHSDIDREYTVYEITRDNERLGKLKVKPIHGNIKSILSKYLETDVKLIMCGGGDPIVSPREQWNDGANTLAIAPGEVIVYSRNYVTNQILKDNGITVHTIPSSELSRGRGGPRCMSMPLYREDIE